MAIDENVMRFVTYFTRVCMQLSRNFHNT